MFLRCTTRKKNGKEHRYWNLVENRRVGVIPERSKRPPLLKASPSARAPSSAIKVDLLNTTHPPLYMPERRLRATLALCRSAG